MKKVIKLPSWVNVYPQGTKEGDEEQGLFIALARNPKWTWRSVAALAKESNLSKERVEEILVKYYKKKMVYQNPDNPDQWGYWERVPQDMLPTVRDSISTEDHDTRSGSNSKITFGQLGSDFKMMEAKIHCLGKLNKNKDLFTKIKITPSVSEFKHYALPLIKRVYAPLPKASSIQLNSIRFLKGGK